MIRAIEDVVKVLKSQPKLELIQTDHLSPLIIKAITDVISITNSKKVNINRNILNSKELIQSSEIVAKLLETSFDKPNHPIFLKSLKRTRDENLHSDYIAAIIRNHPESLFLFNLSGHLISVQREVRLDYIDSSLKGTNLGARRIDLLIESSKHILIIENKIDSTESKDQTEDYYQVIKSNSTKAVLGLMLSPLGIDPMCPQYRKMTYYQLFLILNQISERIPILEYYLAELFDIFIKPLNRRPNE